MGHENASSLPDGPASRGALAEQVSRLEAYMVELRARGEEVPPQAEAMFARLREVVTALEGLDQSFAASGRPPRAPADRDAD